MDAPETRKTVQDKCMIFEPFYMYAHGFGYLDILSPWFKVRSGK
jgi:hypothetical protein